MNIHSYLMLLIQHISVGTTALSDNNPGGMIYLFGGEWQENIWGQTGGIFMYATKPGYPAKILSMNPEGTFSWNGQPISVTSDERKKDNISEISDEVLDAWGDVNWYSFKYKEAINQKSDNARTHLGLIAQRIIKCFEEKGLDACELGIVCHEVWNDEYQEVEVTKEDGTISKEKKLMRSAGDLYTVRYEEALSLESAYQRRKVKLLEERLEKLEKLIK